VTLLTTRAKVLAGAERVFIDVQTRNNTIQIRFGCTLFIESHKQLHKVFC
jgi:hypothetical protein